MQRKKRSVSRANFIAAQKKLRPRARERPYGSLVKNSLERRGDP